MHGRFIPPNEKICFANYEALMDYLSRYSPSAARKYQSNISDLRVKSLRKNQNILCLNIHYHHCSQISQFFKHNPSDPLATYSYKIMFLIEYEYRLLMGHLSATDKVFQA